MASKFQIYKCPNSILYIWKTNAFLRSPHGFIWASDSEQMTVGKWQWANGSVQIIHLHIYKLELQIFNFIILQTVFYKDERQVPP